MVSKAPRVEHNRPVHQQIMRRIIPILAGVFILFSLVGMLLLYSNIRASIQQNHLLILNERSNEIESLLEQVAADASALAGRAPALAFAEEARSETDANPGSASFSQFALQRDFLRLLGDRSGQYEQIRFVTVAGSVWTSVSNINGLLDTDLGLKPAELIGDRVFQSSLNSSRTTFGPITIRRDALGTSRIVMQAYAPVIDLTAGGEVIGVVEVTVSARPLLDRVRTLPGRENLRWLLLNNQGRFLADSEALRVGGTGVVAQNTYQPLEETEPDLAALLVEITRDQTLGFLGVDAVSSQLINVGNVPDMPWSLVIVERDGLGAAGFWWGMLAIVLGCLVAALFSSWTISRALRQRLAPLSAARAMAHRLAEGSVEDTLTPPSSNADELGLLMEAFKRISLRLHELTLDLDEQNQQRTRVLESARKVSRSVSGGDSVESLLRQAVNLIADEYHLYYAQAFVLDDVGLNAVLVYGRGEVGRALLQQGYRVLVGSPTVVGYVTRTSTMAYLPDVTIPGDIPYVSHSRLPDTRSELALPLQVGDQLLGVLDLHSSRPRAIPEDEIQLFQMIADQLAVALLKTRQLVQAEQRIQQTEAASRQAVRSTWEETERRHGLAEAYRYDLVDVEPAPPNDTGGYRGGDIAALSAPIVIRGEVIGTIAAAAPEGLPFTEGDHATLKAIADRVALAMEGARLFQETQTSLAVTSTLYQLSRHLNEADQLQDIIQAVVVTIAPDSSGGQIWLFDDYPPGSQPKALELRADWSFRPRPERVGRLTGTRFVMADSLFLSAMEPSNVKLIVDVNRDRRLDDSLRTFFARLDARAVVLVPISVRGQWRGLLTVEFGQPRSFSESEGRIYSALIDQAGVAIDNRLLMEQTALTLDQIERLYEASRQINVAQNDVDLVKAVLGATTLPGTLIELGLLEGDLDTAGWPTRMRRVARGAAGSVVPLDESVSFSAAAVGMLRRAPRIVADAGGVEGWFPLFSGTQPIAMLHLRSMEADAFSDEDREIYTALAGQISIVLQNRRLLRSTELALDESQRLYAASRAISMAQDLRAVYQAAAEALAQGAPELMRIVMLLAGPVPGYDAGFFDTVHVWEQVVALDAPYRVGTRLNAEKAPYGTLMQNAGDTAYFPQVAQNLADHPRLRAALERGGAESVLVLSMQTQRQWFGVLLFESAQSDAFEAKFQQFGRAIASQVAIAVENRLLFDEAQMEAQRALALAEVGQLATRVSGQFDQAISEVFERVAEPAQYDRWLLALVDEENPRLLRLVTRRSPQLGDQLPAEQAYDLETSDHSIVDAVRQNVLLLVNDPASYPAFRHMDGEWIADMGKHIATPIRLADRVAGALLVGRSLDSADLDERDEQLVRTLAAQLAVAVDNRRLFRAAEEERTYLSSILETMPTGVVVLDARTFHTIQANEQAERLLGRPIIANEPFDVASFNLIRTGTTLLYPADELAIFHAVEGEIVVTDDLSVLYEDGTQTDLLLNAAPVRNARGEIDTIVAAFQDIRTLRLMENTLQNTLRDQIALYEATRALADAPDVEAALDASIAQLVILDPTDAYIVLLDENTGDLIPARGLQDASLFNVPQDLFEAQIVLYPDVEQSELDANVKAMLLGDGVQAVATVPLRTRDTLLGWVVVLYDHPVSFSIDNERFLSTLADNAAVALDNRNLFVRTEMAFQEARTLYEISRALANATEPQHVVQAVVTRLNQPHISQVVMAIPSSSNPELESLVVVSHWQREGSNSMNLEGLILNAEQFAAWRLIASPNLLTMDDVELDVSLDDIERMGLTSIEVRSIAVLPLRSGTRRIGVMWLASDQPHAYSERDRRIYQSFIEQASLSMEAGRLLQQTERRARQLATSAQVSQIASSILDINTLLPQIVNMIRDAFGYDHVQVFLMDAVDEYAILRASTGEAGRQLLSIHHKLAKGSKSVIGTVTSTGEPAIALDTADARFVHKPNPYLPLTRSEMALPLLLKGKVVGALDVQSNTPNAFGDEDVEVLTTLAAQISVALDNARLFEQTQHRARDMSFLFEVTTAAAAPDKPLAGALQDVADRVRDALGVLIAAVYLIEDYEDHTGQEHQVLRALALSGSGQPLSELSEIYLGSEASVLSQIVAEQEPRLIDVTTEYRYMAIHPNAVAAAAAPLVSGAQTVGVVVVEDSRPNAFTEDTTRLLMTLTNSLSAIVQSARLLEQVQEQNLQLRELDRLKSDFLANMSHELRTPLNSIIGFSRVILKGIDGPLTEMQEQDLSTIYNSGTHLLGLINDILDQAKISSGKMSIHSDYFDIKPVVEGVRSIGIGLVKDKAVEMKLEIASGLPRCFGDEVRVRQVLLNLVSNAAKFTQQGSVTIRAYLERHAGTGDEMVRVDVQDTGIGIAEKDIPLLFEAFRQVDSSLTRTVGGTGLGLPIAKSLIEMQGGQMLVHSVVDQGSTFSITIPLAPAAAGEDVPPPPPVDVRKTLEVKKPSTAPLPPIFDPAPQPPSFDPAPKPPPMAAAEPPSKMRTMSMPMMSPVTLKRQILLIEDEPERVDQIRRALQREGFDIFAASISLEAEAMASGLRPTLIIMSAEFNDGHGWDILKRLREREDTHDIPVIVAGLSDDAERAITAGAFAYLQRPFLPEQLQEAVRRAEMDARTERILIIDDQPDSTRLIRDLLDQAGSYRVFTAHSGIEGMSLVARRRPDLVILDLRMPDLDGFAVLGELRANPETARIPVIIVTADTLNAEEQGKLAKLDVIYKSDLSRENSDRFIAGVKKHLNTAGNR